MTSPQPTAPIWRGRASRFLALIGSVLLLGAGALAYERHASAVNARARGEALFHGTAPMPGQLAGHDAPLLPIATRCSNCHEALSVVPGQRIAGSGSSTVPAPGITTPTAARSYAMSLDRVSLETARSRRGGPPSRFDSARLCTLLRTGVDPAQVLIPPTMPRYQATDAQCGELWAYLMTR